MLLVAAAACSGARVAPSSAAGAPSRLAWDYDVTVDATLDLEVRATFTGPGTSPLRVDDAAGPFVEGLELQDGGAWRPATLGDPSWATRCATQCTIRYKFRLRSAAEKVADLDVAILAGGAILAPPSTWLVRPAEAGDGRYRFHVTTPAGITFATGVRGAGGAGPGAAAGSYEATTASLEESAFAAFGALRTAHLADPGIEQAIARDLPLSDEVVSRWLRAEVAAVTNYFGRAPDGHAMIFVVPGTAEMTGGKTLGGGGASLVVRLGAHVSARDIMDDWVTAHELVHVAFPDLDRRHTWFSEGLATYVEPLARQRAGLVSREKVWAELIDGLPQGQPGPRDGALDGASDWARVYWGGAMYFFLADVRIRERTAGARGLEDALRAIVATGANVEAMLPLDRVLALGDAATGTRVMQELYAELGTARGKVDLPAVLGRLGVRAEGGSVRFDDGAPLAAVRDAILPRSPR